MVDRSTAPPKPDHANHRSEPSAAPDRSHTENRRDATTDRTDDSAKSSDAKSVDSKSADSQSIGSRDDAPAQQSDAQVTDPVAVFDAAIAAAQGQVVDKTEDVDAKADDKGTADKTSDEDRKTGAAADKPAATVMTGVDADKAAAPQQPKSADAAAIALAVAPQPAVAAAPKTSVPQVPRIAAVSQKAAAKFAAPADVKAAPADDNSDTDGVAAPDDKLQAALKDAAEAQSPVAHRAEKFSETLAAGNIKPRTDSAPATKAPDLDTPQAAQNLLAQPPGQQTAAAVTPAQSAVQAASKPVPLDGVAVEIAAKANEGTHRFEIRLDPPELGRIEVRLDVDKTGQVVSHITADRGDTLDLLRRDSADLQRALQDAGLKTGDNGLQFSLRDQNANQNNDNNRLADSAQLIARDDNMPAIEPSQIPYRRMSGLPGGVDIRV